MTEVRQPEVTGRRAALELLVLVVLCALVVGPKRLLPGAAAVGQPTRDLFDHLALLDMWHLHTRVWNFPDGGSLVPPDLTGMLLAAPFMGLGRAAAYNWAVLWQLWLAAAGAWLLGRRLGSGLVAGVAFGLSPYLVGQAFSGEAETLAAWPLPVTAWLLEVGRERRSRAIYATAGVVAAVGAVASWYHGAFLAAYIAGFVLLGDRGRAWPAPVAFAAAVVVPAWLYARALAAPDQLFRGPRMADYLARFPQALAAMSADPAGWIGRPAAGATHVDFIGPALWGLALFGSGPLRRRGGGARAWWWAVAVAGLVLSLGPVLHVGGAAVLGWAPYRLLARLPVLGLMRLPYRWMLVAMLGLAALAARGGRRFPLLAASLLFLETVLVGVPHRPSTEITPPSVEAEVTGPVLDLPPRTLGEDARGHYLVWQRMHRQPVPYAVLMQAWSRTLANEPLFVAVAALDSRDPISTRPAAAAQFRQQAFALEVHRWRNGQGDWNAVAGAAARLRGMGFTQVILHRDLMAPADADQVEAMLRRELGAPAKGGGRGAKAVLWNL